MIKRKLALIFNIQIKNAQIFELLFHALNYSTSLAHRSKAVAWICSVKNAFLKISHIQMGNTCVGASI